MMGVPRDWHDEWIRENVLSYPSYKAMNEDYKKLFDDTCTVAGLKRHCLRIGIHKPRLTHKPHTKEQNEWFDNYYPTHGVMDTMRAYNQKFNANMTRDGIKSWANIRHIAVNDDVMLKNHLRTMHGKGSKRALKDIGDTRIESGRLVMKTEDGTWKPIGKAIYEQAYGKVPKGYHVIHLNGDRFDYRLENLMVVPLRVWGVIANYGMIFDDAELTKASIKWAELHNAVKDAKGGKV